MSLAEEHTRSLANQERRARALSQRLLLIEERAIGERADPRAIAYSVMGTTGNVYEVSLPRAPDAKWECDCPDHTIRHKACKHIYFVRVRVLRDAPRADEWWTALQRLEGAPHGAAVFDPSDAAITAPHLQGALHAAKKRRENDGNPARQDEAEQREWIGAECAICLDEMHASDPVVYCRAQCGQSVHKVCWKRCARTIGERCVYCRADMRATKTTIASEYINLARNPAQ